MNQSCLSITAQSLSFITAKPMEASFGTGKKISAGEGYVRHFYVFKGRKSLYNRKTLLSDSSGRGVWNTQSCWVKSLSTTLGLFCFRCSKNIWRIWDGWGKVGQFNLSHFLPKITSPNIHSGSLKFAYWERVNFQVSYWYSRYAQLYTYIHSICVRRAYE